MSTYIVTSDRIGNANQFINYVCKKLKQKGHNAINGGIGPSRLQNLALKSSSKGKIGVQICDGRAPYTISDFYYNIIHGAYHFKQMHQLGASKETHNPLFNTKNYNNGRMHDEPGANRTPYLRELFYNKTPREWNLAYGDKARLCYGNNMDEAIEMLLGGSIGSTKGNLSINFTAPSYKDMLMELISVWDGEVEVKAINDTLYINKINKPDNTHITLEEGVNIQINTITNTNSNTVNKLIVYSENHDYNIIIEDEYLQKQFGIVDLKEKAYKYVKSEIKKEKKEEEDDDDTTKKSKDKKTTKKEEEPKQTDVNKREYKLTKKEFETFAKAYWGKCQRDNGHTIDLKTTNTSIKIGDWVKVKIPSYDEEAIMYVVRVNHVFEPFWSTELTLADYPSKIGGDVIDSAIEQG